MATAPKNQPNKKPKRPGMSQMPNMLPGGDSFWVNLATSVLLLLLLAGAYSYFAGSSDKPADIALSQVAQDINKGLVASVEVNGNGLKVVYLPVQAGADKTEKKSKKEPESSLSDSLKNYGVSSEALGKVSIDIAQESGFQYWFMLLAPFLVPLLLLAFFVWYLSRQVRGAGMQAFSFGQSKPRVIDPNDEKSRVTFRDVAGAKEAKQELLEIVDFLKNPKKFLDIGARIPKGILLMGAPGTGKTLLARAVAGEAGVPFFSISGSEFVEMFVGVGASRVRDLFLTAKKAAPSIIFVDEIDAVGRVRGTGVGGGNDEREQTLNQILVEMDGFEPNEKVIVMAATNRPDVLDPALLRPGRFDRRVTIDLPDRQDRLDILKIHARKKPLAEDVNLEVVAERTPGFTSATNVKRPHSSNLCTIVKPPRVQTRSFRAVLLRFMKQKTWPESGSRPTTARTAFDSPSKDLCKFVGSSATCTCTDDGSRIMRSSATTRRRPPRTTAARHATGP